MSFEMLRPVSMEQVPQPMVRTRANKYRVLWDSICELKRQTALPVKFDSLNTMEACRTALRKIAKREGEFLSTSRDRHSLTIFLWLEPKEVAHELRQTKGEKS